MVELKPFLMSPPLPVARSKRAKWIARSFGLALPAKIDPTPSSSPRFDEMTIASLVPAPGEILLITGPSGAGKSSLLRAIRSITKHTVHWIDLDRVRPRRERPVIDLFGRTSLMRVLEMLSRVGLAEVWTYLRTPRQLSEGQRWRLRLAMAMLRAKRSARSPRRPQCRSPRSIIVCDEFAALLDRITAAIVARMLRRAISSTEQSAIVATSHEDLIRALGPDAIVRCDFGRVTIERRGQ
jgi:ABC-type ATPase with predicted acetyltransferase domain